MTGMSARVEALINAGAAVVVIITAMVDPRISIAVSVVCLLGLASYHVAHR